MTQEEKISSLISSRSKLKINKNDNRLVSLNENSISTEQSDYDDQISEITENDSNTNDDLHKRICVVTNWSQFRSGLARFQFENINTNLCNHIIFSSVSVSQEEDSKFTVRPIRQNDYSKT